MKKAGTALLMVLSGLSFACDRKDAKTACVAEESNTVRTSPPVAPFSPEYLLAHGFKADGDVPDCFKREHVRLRDVLRDLELSSAAFERAMQLPLGEPIDIRNALVPGAHISVAAENPDKDWVVAMDTLNNLDAVCTATVTLHPIREYLTTDGPPRLRVKSVTVPEDRGKPVRVTFEFAAMGKKPVSAWAGGLSFHAIVTRDGSTRSLSLDLSFADGAPRIITAIPNKPVVISVDVASIDRWRRGEYVVRISLQDRFPQSVDYQWKGAAQKSDVFRFTIK